MAGLGTSKRLDMVRPIDDLFPGLRGTGYLITSPEDDRYNCIAWAAGVSDVWWWPLGDPTGTHWPSGVPREETVAAFLLAFASLGYVPCGSEALETGYEKVALFADAGGCPTHAARQLAGGAWTSKLGALADIEHPLRAIEGVEYGTVVLLLKRPISRP